MGSSNSNVCTSTHLFRRRAGVRDDGGPVAGEPVAEDTVGLHRHRSGEVQRRPGAVDLKNSPAAATAATTATAATPGPVPAATAADRADRTDRTGAAAEAASGAVSSSFGELFEGEEHEKELVQVEELGPVDHLSRERERVRVRVRVRERERVCVCVRERESK